MPTEPEPAEPDTISSSRKIASEQFLVPAWCFSHDASVDPLLRAVDQLTPCSVGPAPCHRLPDFATLTLRCRNRRDCRGVGDLPAARRLLDALLARRMDDAMGRCPTTPPPRGPQPDSGTDADTGIVDCALANIVEDLLRGSSFVHCCGLVYAAFLSAEAAAASRSSLNLRHCCESATDAVAIELAEELAPPAAPTVGCHHLPVRRSAPTEWRLAAPAAECQDFAAAIIGLLFCCDCTEEASPATVGSVPTIRAAQDGDNAQLPSSSFEEVVEEEDDEGPDDLMRLVWRPAEAAGIPTLSSSGSHFRPSVDPRLRRMLANAPPWPDYLANSRCIGSEMLTQF